MGCYGYGGVNIVTTPDGLRGIPRGTAVVFVHPGDDYPTAAWEDERMEQIAEMAAVRELEIIEWII